VLCFLCGTDWILKYDLDRFGFKGLLTLARLLLIGVLYIKKSTINDETSLYHKRLFPASHKREDSYLWFSVNTLRKLSLEAFPNYVEDMQTLRHVWVSHGANYFALLKLYHYFCKLCDRETRLTKYSAFTFFFDVLFLLKCGR
jgi:hypothetical protein